MNTILVTGAAGFIGSHVCDRLLERGDKVIGVDNFNNYYDCRIKYDNLKICQGNKRFELIRADIRDKPAMDAVFKNGFNKVIHLAAMAGVRYSIENPLLYFDVNVVGTINLLSLAHESGVDNFVYCSSSSVYGEMNGMPFKETLRGKPVSQYGCSKLAAESYCYYYHAVKGLNINVLRFFTVYGPRGRPDMAIYKFTKAINEGQELPVYGDGTSVRDYTYVGDVVEGVLSACDSEYGYEIFNLGNSNPIALNQMIRMIEQTVGKKAKIKKMPVQMGDVTRTCADISKAKRMLNYNPRTDFESGVAKFVGWFNSIHAG